MSARAWPCPRIHSCVWHGVSPGARHDIKLYMHVSTNPPWVHVHNTGFVEKVPAELGGVVWEVCMQSLGLRCTISRICPWFCKYTYGSNLKSITDQVSPFSLSLFTPPQSRSVMSLHDTIAWSGGLLVSSLGTCATHLG